MSFLGRLLGKREQIDDQQWQTPVVQEICAAMIRLIPDNWDSAALVPEVPDSRSVHRFKAKWGARTADCAELGLTHSPITPQPIKDFAVRTRDYVLPDNEVFAATRKLELGWMERKKTFKRAIIIARRDSDGWEIQSNYEHD